MRKVMVMYLKAAQQGQTGIQQHCSSSTGKSQAAAVEGEAKKGERLASGSGPPLDLVLVKVLVNHISLVDAVLANHSQKSRRKRAASNKEAGASSGAGV